MFSPTPQERRALLFLIAVALFGIGIDYYCKSSFSSLSLPAFSQDIGKIDLNHADKDLLLSVPGIGEKLAERIIIHRTQTPFQSLEELKKIKGITNKRYEQIKEYLLIK